MLLLLAQLNPSDYKEFGFSAVLLIVILGGIGYFVKRGLEIYGKQLERKTTKDIEREERLTSAQIRSYDRHVEIAEENLKSVQAIEAATNKSSISIEMLVISGELKKRQLDHIEQYTGDLHAAFRDAVDVAKDLAQDRPDIQRRLSAIRESMERKK